MTVEQWSEFNIYHARNREQATQLRPFVVLCVGVGATGSHVAALLAQAGCGLVLLDREELDAVNLTRHYVTDRKSLQAPKAHALAQKLRAEVPSLQSIRAIQGDIELLSEEELRVLLRGASLVVGSSGRDAVDHRLNLAARDLHLPLVVPSLWADNEGGILGDVQIIPWHYGAARRGACFECIRPRADNPVPAAEAQPGRSAEVVRVASLTAELVLALLLIDSPQGRALMRQLQRGAGYFVIPRWPPSLRGVLTRARRGCPACSTTTAFEAPSMTIDRATMRDLAIGAALVSTVFWHQLVPGLDVAATLGLIGVAGLWWRGRLPTYAVTAQWLRRTLSGH